MEVVKIYILLDENQQIRYVGKTNQSLDKRLIQHIFEGRNNNKTKKERWINSLLKKEKTPTIDLIDEVYIDEWSFWEKYWISQIKSWGFNLTNGTDGGDEGGYMLGYNHTVETKKKMSETKKGKIPYNIDLINEYTSKKKKEVISINDNNQIIGRYASLNEAVKNNQGLSIHRAIKNKLKAGRYFWSYSENYCKNEFQNTINIYNSKIKKQEPKKIIQKDLEGNIIKIWSSIKEIQKSGINVTSVLYNKRKTARGYMWEFLPNY